MLEHAFETDDKILCLWFNGWKFEGFEDAKAVVIETIVDELRRALTNVDESRRRRQEGAEARRLAKACAQSRWLCIYRGNWHTHV
jgi:hypothetical protein